MLLTCPNCETVFRIDSERIGDGKQAVRCSVCAYVWQAKSPMSVSEADPGEMRSAVGAMLTPLIILVMVIGIAIGAVTQRATITAYVPGLIGVFDKAGLTVQPQTDKLQIADLKADYAGDTLRLRGKLMNRSAVYAHAPPLAVTILSASGDLLGSHVLEPDDSVIRPGMASEFFTQIVIGEGLKPTVTVTMRADPVAGSSF